MEYLPVQESDPSRITNLSTTTVVFLIVFLPAITLLLLIWLSYLVSPWA
ncbi:MAG: hypothetical protein ACR2N7_00390 [Acidimicrobiia bacterium]